MRSSGASIFVNEMEVVRLHSGRVEQRAEALAQSLAPLAGAVSVRVSPNDPKAFRLFVADHPWLTVTRDEAREAGTAPKALAEVWAGRLRDAYSLPGVKLSTSHVKVGIGGSQAVTLVGSHVADAVVRSTDERVVKVTRSGLMVVLQGVAPGKADAIVTGGGDSASLQVSVQPMAAYFPQSLTATVTGVPASRETVVGSVVAAVNSDLKTVPGAQIDFDAPPVVAEIGTGDTGTYQVRVRVTGPDAFANEGIVNVVVKNSPIGYRSESELWYCNDPEQIRRPGRVFAAALKPGTPARMLYHHINRSGTSMVMFVEAINNSNSPAKLLIMPGDAEPVQNPVSAGFEAADRFVRSWANYSGEVVDIPPYSVLPISMRKMARNDTMSGLCYLRLLEGGADQLVVRAEARYPSAMSSKSKLALKSSTPWRLIGTRPIGDVLAVPIPDTTHIYPNPFKEEDVTYSVGGPYRFVRIGQSPIARQDNLGSLDGNFGVMYTIKASVDNPNSFAAEVEVVYEASAGYGGALFLIDGQVRRTPLLQPKEEIRVSRFKLDPHASKAIRIMTVPMSGSSYPTTITIRSVQPMARNSSTGKS